MPTENQTPNRSYAFVITGKETDEIFIKMEDGSYVRKTKKDLVQSLEFSKWEGDKPFSIMQRISCEGIGDVVKSYDSLTDDFLDAVGCKIFVKYVNGMEPISLTRIQIVIKEPILHDPKNYCGQYYIVSDPNKKRPVSSRDFFAVKDGVVKRTGELEYCRRYVYNPSSCRFETDKIREVYGRLEDAVFYTSAKIQGENNKSWSDLVCLSDDEKRQVNDLVKNFKETLESMGVSMCYDQSDGKLRFTKSDKNFPAGFFYQDVERSCDFNPDFIEVPDSAYYDPEIGFSICEITDTYGTHISYKEPVKATEPTTENP